MRSLKAAQSDPKQKAYRSPFWFLLLVIMSLVLFSSCTVQKRVHRKGWYVSWHHTKRSVNSEKSSAEIEKKSEVVFNQQQTASAEIEIEPETFERRIVNDIAEDRELPTTKDEIPDQTENNSKTEDILYEEDYPRPSPFAPILAGFGTIGFFFVGLTLGWISILVPIAVSVVIALIAWLGMRYQIKKGNGTKYNKNFLWWMFSCIVAAFALYFLFFGGVLGAAPIGFLGLGVLVLLSGAFLGKIKKDQQDKIDAAKPEEPESTSGNSENTANKNQEKLGLLLFALAIVMGLLGLILLSIGWWEGQLLLVTVAFFVLALVSMVAAIYLLVKGAQ